MTWAWAILVILLLGAVAYWLLITTEGTYLGPRIVILMYDWVARRYDAMKHVRYVDEAQRLAIPLLEALDATGPCRVLDVATGTARLPVALAHQYPGDVEIVGVDRSARMLSMAHRTLRALEFNVALARCDASRLPFEPATFDAVCCLEALEFMPRPRAVLFEFRRVAKPGAVILLSNRVGTDALFYPGRMARRGVLEQALAQAGFEDIRTDVWQVHYDLVWARTPLVDTPAPNRERTP